MRVPARRPALTEEEPMSSARRSIGGHYTRWREARRHVAGARVAVARASPSRAGRRTANTHTMNSPGVLARVVSGVSVLLSPELRLGYAIALVAAIYCG